MLLLLLIKPHEIVWGNLAPGGFPDFTCEPPGHPVLARNEMCNSRGLNTNHCGKFIPLDVTPLEMFIKFHAPYSTA